jgi:hypothetical protein
MSGFRKISALIVWLILVIAIIAGFLWFKSRNRGNADIRTVLPESTAIIFECSSFPSLIAELQSNNKIWKDLSGSGIFENALINIKGLDSLIKSETQIRDFVNLKVCISLVLKANRSPGVLFCIPESVRKQDKVLLKYFAGKLQDFNYNKRRFEGNLVYDMSWKTPSGNQNFSFAVLDDIIIGSFTSELVEESIRQYNPERNLTSKPEFSVITKTIGDNVSGNLFINYKNADEILKYYLNSDFAKGRTFLKDFASWGALDVEIFSDKIILNGFTSLVDSLNQEMMAFRGQEPVEFNCPNFLPDAVSFFKVYGFSDKALYFKKLSEFLAKNPNSRELTVRKQNLLSSYGVNLDQVFSEIISDEYGCAGMSSGRTSNPFFFMELKSQSLAEQQFVDWITNWALKNGQSPQEFMLDYKIDNNTTITVYKMPVGGIPSMVFGPAFSSPENDYFTFINNYLVFADSYISLKEFIYRVVLGNTLASEGSFSSLGENISSRSNLYYFAKPGSFAERSEEIFIETGHKLIHQSKESISRFNAVSIQFSVADELMYNHVLINYSGVSSGSVNTVWESRIDTSTVFKPEVVINHVTGEKEIFIQDQKNQIYLISNAGIILWKQMLDGPLKSDVFQVDYYKNGKRQYLFSTRNKIYLLDRNGNSVEKFPVEFRSPATAGISVFDYDKDGTIRICVPGEDRKIYMYDKDGKIIPGWQADHTDNEVIQAVQHFRVGKKDYIVAIDKYKFYILDRKGSNRVALKQYFQVSSSNSFYLDLSRGENLARLVTTDTAGNIMRIYFTGTVEKILERGIDTKHYFVYADIDGDQKGEYITASEKTLTVLHPDLSESFKLEFTDEISFKPIVYKFSATDNKIGIVLRNPGIIYLYDNNGSLYNGFPLKGSAPFSISSFPELSGRFNLIVGTENNFLYNYSVK